MTKPGLEIRDIPGGVEFGVVVSAGSRRSGISGLYGGSLKVAVQAPPERGKANAEVEKVVAEWLGVEPRNVRVVSGATSRRKRVAVEGAKAADVTARVDSSDSKL